MKSPLFGREFSLAEGLNIQDKQFKQWSTKLKPEVAERLHREIIEQNRTLPSDACGYDVWRGTEMDAFLYNLKDT